MTAPRAAHAKAHDQIVADARKTYYKALEVEFTRLVKEALAVKDFTRVEQEFNYYGQYLESHPDALLVG